MKPKVGDEYPVWWDTEDGREAGQHMARIIAILPYTGRYPESFNAVLRLTAPGLVKGYTEMAAKI